MSANLKEKVILVTGGSRGIGRAIVLESLRNGASVLFTYASRSDAADSVLNEAKVIGGEVRAVQADVRDLEQAQKIVQQALAIFGRLDGLVNNAGITRDKALLLMESTDWSDVLETNLTGVFNYCRAVIATMLKQRSGRIVNITSVGGLAGLARQVNYSASKAGVIGFTKSLAKEVAGYGIAVNAIAPGYIESDMTKGISDQRREAFCKQIPMGRFGTPEEVARLVTVLLDDHISYVTGQVLVVDGGLTT